MIPIPKGSKKDTSDIRNYRGIALSSLLSKLFDSCIISLNTVVFKSDDLQLAYTNFLTLFKSWYSMGNVFYLPEATDDNL